MQDVRSFIAVPLPPSIAKSATRLLANLKHEDDGIRWVPTDNLHLTLKFLGDVNNRELPAVCQAIRKVCADFDPFPLEFSGTRALPSLEKARVLCVGVRDESETLTTMVGRLEKQMADLGFKPEPRDYVPHLTLGRVRKTSSRASAAVLDRLAEYRTIELGQMIADEVLLMGSFLEKSGPSYHVMDTIEL